MFSIHANHLAEHHNKDVWSRSCKTSEMQTPISLSQRFAYKKKLKHLKVDNFDICERVKVTNDGYTVVVKPTSCSCQRPKLSGGILTQNYTMDSIHFHWPSEHTIDGLRYDMEAHFVFYADKYPNFQIALEHPYGLTVLAVLFVETTYTASNNFRTIGDAVKLVATKPGGSTTTTKKIKFHEFLPYDHRDYFAYEGSLTTNHCAPFVNWVIYKNHANISHLDYKDVTSTMYNKNNELQISNNRSLQALNDRIVYMPDWEQHER